MIADLFVLPSKYEIFGMVMLESLYFGVPVLSSKTAGSLEILKNEKLGKIVELEENRWINEIQYMLSQEYNPSDMKNYIEQNHNWDILAKKYLQIVGEF